METQQPNLFGATKKQAEEYLHDRIWLLKLQTGEKAARVTAALFLVIVTGLLVFFVLLFLSIMAGFYFASITNSLFAGFSMVAGFYVLLLLLLVLSRKKIERRIINTVIRIIFAKTEEREDGKQQS